MKSKETPGFCDIPSPEAVNLIRGVRTIKYPAPALIRMAVHGYAGVSGIKTPHHHHAVGGISWRQSRARCCTSAPACCSAARSSWRSRKRTQAFQRSTASSLSGAIRAVNLSEPSTRETRENEGTAGSHAFAIFRAREAVNLMRRVRTIEYPPARHGFEPRFTVMRRNSRLSC